MKRLTLLQKILVGLGSVVVIGILGIVIFTILFLVFNTPRVSKLSGKTVWELKYVLIAGQQILPIDIVPSRFPPEIKFGPDNNYEGNDGCNGFQGYFLDDGNGNLSLGPAEATELGCIIYRSGQPIATNLKFLHMLNNTVRYELLSGELQLSLSGSSDIMVFQSSNEPESVDYLGVGPMPRWECQELPYLFYFLGDRCRFQ